MILGKALATFIVAGGVLLVSASSVVAAPFFAEGNPNIVANYHDGIHTIPGEQEDIHTGMDVVMRAGKSGNFQQWFLGDSEQEGFHGEHSLWKESKDGTCKNGDVLIEDAHPGWGDYLNPEADYCVKTNEFQKSK